MSTFNVSALKRASDRRKFACLAREHLQPGTWGGGRTPPTTQRVSGIPVQPWPWGRPAVTHSPAIAAPDAPRRAGRPIPGRLARRAPTFGPAWASTWLALGVFFALRYAAMAVRESGATAGRVGGAAFPKRKNHRRVNTLEGRKRQQKRESHSANPAISMACRAVGRGWCRSPP